MPTLQEIDRREAHGLEVTLLRCRETGQLAVLVIDDVEDDTFALEVAPEEALEVFRHPYAYLPYRAPVFHRRGATAELEQRLAA